MVTITARGRGDERPNIGFMIEQSKGVGITSLATHEDGAVPVQLDDGSWRSVLSFPDLPLHSGDYVISAFLFDETGLAVYDEWFQFLHFSFIFPSCCPAGALAAPLELAVTRFHQIPVCPEPVEGLLLRKASTGSARTGFENHRTLWVPAQATWLAGRIIQRPMTTTHIEPSLGQRALQEGQHLLAQVTARALRCWRVHAMSATRRWPPMR